MNPRLNSWSSNSSSSSVTTLVYPVQLSRIGSYHCFSSLCTGRGRGGDRPSWIGAPFSHGGGGAKDHESPGPALRPEDLPGA
eukprot:7282489-Prorocentrum_lima.AAC.1